MLRIAVAADALALKSLQADGELLVGQRNAEAAADAAAGHRVVVERAESGWRVG